MWRPAVRMARALGWYWTLLDGHSEASTWLKFALNVPDPDATVSERDRALVEALQALSTLATAFGSDTADEVEQGMARLQDINAELERLSVDGDPLILLLRPMLLFFSGNAELVIELLGHAVRASDPWVRAAAHSFRARVNENEGNICSSPSR